MARTRNISIGVTADLHARYCALGLIERRRLLQEIRAVMERRLAGGEGGRGVGLSGAGPPTGEDPMPTAGQAAAIDPVLAPPPPPADGGVDLPSGW